MAESQNTMEMEEVVVTPGNENIYSLSNAPYASISKPELDSIIDLYTSKNAKDQFLPDFARQIAGEISVENPEFSYENLSSGKGAFFDFNEDEEIRNADPKLRSLSDRDIIEMFVVDPKGRPLEVPTLSEGFFRDIIPQGAGMTGVITGAKAGARLPGPPQAKLVGGVGLSLLGGLGFYEAGKLATDVLMGEERPMLPGEKVEYEKGKTLAGVIPWLFLPYTISKEVSLGTAQYLTNLGKNAKTPAGVKLAEKAENFLRKTATEGREKPIRYLGIESTIGLGQLYGAGEAEKYYEGSGLARILGETGGGITASVLINPAANVIKYLGEVKKIASGLVRDVQEKGFKGTLGPLREKRRKLALEKIINVLEKEAFDNVEMPAEFSDDVIKALPEEQRIIRQQEKDAFIEKVQREYLNFIADNLSSDELTKDLIDESGNPINLTSGQRSGSASLLAMEKSLDRLGAGLTAERKIASTKAIKSLRNTILALAQTDDKRATQLAGELAEKVFSTSMQNQLEIATKRVVDAAEKVYGANAETSLNLSERLYDVIETELGLARREENRLWGAVPEVNITTFVDAEGNPTNIPRFIEAFESIARTPEAAEHFTKAMPAFKKFVERKKQELGLAGSEEGQEQLSLFEIAGEEAAEAGVTTKELAEMRSILLDVGKSLSAAEQKKAARVAFNMADALLADLNNAPDVDGSWRTAYDMARSYSRALNDTYTRAFGGEALAKDKLGADKTSPELLAKRLLTGGNDPTYVRIEQINEIGRFGQKYGIEGADDTVGTLASLTESILRNARKAAFDPTTGEINPTALNKWLETNKDLMNQFPALKRDLERASTANILLDTTKQAHKKRLAEIKSQISFMNLLPSTTESPTTAVASALSSKRPLQGLNELERIVSNKELPENVRNEARNGLKASVLEWAFTKAGGSHSGNLRPSVIFDAFFRPVKGAASEVTLSEWLRSKNLISEGEVTSLKTMLNEMVRYEVAETLGDEAESIVGAPNQLLDLYLSITGSAFGTRLQKLFGGGGPGSIIAAGRGAKAFKEAFLNIPQGLQVDVLKEMMENPKLLASFLRKPKSEREALRIREQITQMLFNLGLSPAKTLPAPVFRETMEDDVERLYLPGQEPERDIPGIDSPLTQLDRTPAAPTVAGAAAPRPAPFVVAQAPVASPPPAQQARPADRSRFAAAFPSDITAPFIKQQGIETLLT